jgi:hypothetical protein
MEDFIARWFGWVTVALVPPISPRHSRAYATPVAPAQSSGAGQTVERFDDAARTLVHPYLIAHEERWERVQQLERRRAIHGVEVAR